MRRGLSGFLAAIAFSGPGFAGPADDVVEQVLTAYLETCSAAFNDPTAYLNGLVIPGPSGERVVTRTPDNQIVWVSTSHDDLLEDVQIAGVPGTLQTTCVLTKAMLTPVTNGVDLDVALRNSLAQRSPGAIVVGGSAPQDTPGIVFGSPTSVPVGDSHIFAVSGLFDGLSVVSQVEAHTSYFAISGLHRQEAE